MSSLELKAVGDFSLILQKFKYKKHKLCCIIKILPRLHKYNWLSSINMMQIESELMRICEDIDWKDWENTAKLNTELFIEPNIKIHIKAVHGLASSIMTLMEDTIMPTRDIVLQIEVKHLPLDDKGAARPQTVELQNSTKAKDSKTKKKIFNNNNTELSPKINAKPSAATSRPARSRAKRLRYKDFVLKDNKRSSKEMPEPDGNDSSPNDNGSSLLRYALSGVRVKPPEVKILTLPLTEDEILSTFEKYRTYFDKFFEKNMHKTHVDSYKGIEFIDIMDFISTDTRRSMGKKLIDNYAKNDFSHVALCADGLCPLWTVRLFMDYHKLEHDAAVEHIKAQNMLTYYEEVHGDKTLDSDLEDW